MSERALHIPPAVLALPDLSLLACAVLAEVLDLYRVNGQVFASDGHFATRLHSKPRTVRETITELVAAGHLVREVNYAARHKRLLTPAQQWQISPLVVADSATTNGEICQELWQNPPGVVADSANINTIVNTNTKKERVEAASAATPAAFLEGVQRRATSTKPKKSVARADEVAALPLPHQGDEFTELWASFRTGPKQAGKPLTALALMLKKLGKYPEGFAIVMLEAAIQGNWSGVENPGTAKAYAEWQTEQARRPVLAAAPSPADTGPALNLTFLAEQQAREQAELDAHAARWQARHNPADSGQKPTQEPRTDPPAST